MSNGLIMSIVLNKSIVLFDFFQFLGGFLLNWLCTGSLHRLSAATPARTVKLTEVIVPAGTKKTAEYTPRRSQSDKGQLTSLSILLAAEKLLINQGYHNFSLRKVASAAGLTLGNLQYHFPNKDLLIKAMLNNCIQRYLDDFDRIRAVAGRDPEAQFKAIIADVIRDLSRKQTTQFFPELWSLSNHDEHAIEFMDEMYGKYRQILVEVITQMNPTLSRDQLNRLAVFISSSIEGHTMFVGYSKPWNKETENIIVMATQAFLWLIYSGDIPE